jgi:hypothetical protein
LLTLPRENFLKEQVERATRDIVKQLVSMRKILRRCDHGSTCTIQNEIEFLVGVVLGRILERCIYYLINKKIQVTSDEFLWINNFLFSRAGEFRDYISRVLIGHQSR